MCTPYPCSTLPGGLSYAPVQPSRFRRGCPPVGEEKNGAGYPRNGPGDTTKPNPFTICIVANPALEAPWRSGQFIIDPITEDQNAFDASVAYVEKVLFGLLPEQAERFLGDPSISEKVTMISVFVPGLPAEDANALVAQDALSNLLVARRTASRPFLARYELAAGHRIRHFRFGNTYTGERMACHRRRHGAG